MLFFIHESVFHVIRDDSISYITRRYIIKYLLSLCTLLYNYNKYFIIHESVSLVI